MIEFERLGFSWPEGQCVIEDLSVKVLAGEKVVLLGANGCGKSTLLKIANGLLPASSGSCRYRGDEVSPTRLRTGAFARRFRGEVVLLFQHPEAMLFNPTVRDEIAYGPRQLAWADAQERAVRWATALGLDALLEHAPFRLSGGQKQKVALASILALDPEVLLLDEPTASLDPRTAGWLVDYLLDCGKTVLVSTHNLSMAAELGDRALVLGERGRLLHDGTVAEVLRDRELLEAANLVHRHRHRHAGLTHVHTHGHDWEASR
ncbi:MAG: ABC transporter ATP-binding protein [Betaproteobacteria bacterium]|nr:ABC transporter ATP-binding protein [Betaproteobacteria bacterium]